MILKYKDNDISKTYQAGDGITIEDNNISVSLPTKALSQEAYDALSEEEKRDGSLYITPSAVPDGGCALGVPTGAVIGFLALSAPDGYLVCDGAEYPIAAYPNLSRYIKKQFGASNHFGGDGETTFAVPDLRNLFLRGYYGEAEEHLSGEVGEKQEATQFPSFEEFLSSSTQASIHFMPPSVVGKNNGPVNVDKVVEKATKGVGTALNYGAGFDASDRRYGSLYTSRPVNMAVLYCIKT